MERIFDIFFSGLAIILFAPFLVIICVILRFTGEGKIFYFQERIGKGGRIFRLMKFATMIEDSPNIGTGTITVKDDPRILPVGRFLRKTKVNELPQLFNVFLGNMTLIGPRPLTLQTFNAYSEEAQKIVKMVKPGLSGIGSIIFRNEEEMIDCAEETPSFYNNLIAPYKGSLEIWFVSNRSLILYFSLIFLTIWTVIFPSSSLVWKLLNNLPVPPHELKRTLNYPY